jgi:Predicted phosphotransferase related to Ser/Thr protein kinases
VDDIKVRVDDALKKYLQGVSINGLELTLLHGDASARRYVRIRGGALKKSLVAMVLAPEQARFSEEVMKGPAPPELPFINLQRYLAGIGIRVPEILHVDESLGVVLLEDLGNITLEQEIAQHGEDAVGALYARAIDVLVGLQAATSKHPNPNCLAYTRTFDFDLMRWELDHFREYVVEIDRQVQFSVSERSEVDAAFAGIARELSSLPRVFVHRDFQSRNLMVVSEGLALIDFQDALRGPVMYDLVALLRDSYVVIPEHQLDELIDRYLSSCLRVELPRAEKAEFRRHVDLQTVQRKLKDAGRFVFIDRVKHNPSFLPYIPASLAYVREALNRLPELSRLQDILGKAVPELAR